MYFFMIEFAFNSSCDVRISSIVDDPVDISGITTMPISLYGIIRYTIVAKMASHAIFQYNVLATDDTHNTWTNMIVKMNILRLRGFQGTRIEETVKKSKSKRSRRSKFAITG